MSQEPIILTSYDTITEIRLNKPEKLNALDLELATAFANAVDQVLANDATRVIVISATGRAFVAGGDLSFFRASIDKETAAHQLIGPLHSALAKLAAAPQIIIGSLKGPVAGGGMSLALNLDLLIASDDTTFTFAYSRIGASPDCGGSFALPRLVGTRRALEIALLSDTMDSAEALRLGLVNRVVQRGELEVSTEEFARRLAAGAPMALARTKRLIRQSLTRSFTEQLDVEEESFAECAATQDFSNALDAFFEKQAPVFSGR